MAEIDLLRITGWLKVLPLELRRFGVSMLTPAGINTLGHLKLLYPTQNGQYLRLTPSGWDFLSAIGYSYPKDSRYVTKPEKVLRRNEAAQIMFTCYRAGIDIFADSPDCLTNSSIYLSSAAARRNTEYLNTKVWGGCRLAGIARLCDKAYMVHFLNDEGMYFTSEMELFHKLVSGRCDFTACIYAADSYKTAAFQLMNEPPLSRGKKRPNGWTSFRDACKRTELPLHLLECSNIGAVQLMVMNTPNYREKVARFTIEECYRPPHAELPDTDALLNGCPLLTAVDMDIKRIGRAYRAAMQLGMEKLMVVAMPEQLDTLIELFKSMNRIEFFRILQEPLMAALGLTLYEPSTEQYRTAKGALLYATDIPTRRKAGRPPKQTT